MTPLPVFQVDAFAEKPFTGNPAAVMPLDHWLPDEVMQAIAAENNLSETAFTVPSERDDADYDLRWFTPTVEVTLCGHATLAAGHISDARAAGPLLHQVRHTHRRPRRGRSLAAQARPAGRAAEPRCRAGDMRSARLDRRPLWLAEGCNDSIIVPVESEAGGTCGRARLLRAAEASTGWRSSLRRATNRTSSAGCSSLMPGSTRIR